MKTIQMILKLLPVLLVLLAAGCTLDAPDSPEGLAAPTGWKQFDNYVAIGNSLTAGFMDGGLMASGQMSSYPRLISTKLGKANLPGEFEFSQPWINAPGIGTSDASDTNHVAGVFFYDKGTMSLGTLGETRLDLVQSDLLLAARQPTPYHNLGVPGAQLADVMNAYDRYTAASYLAFGAENPFFDFINRFSLFGNLTVPATSTTPSYETASMFAQAVAKGPTLATVWIGNNDVLGGATAGTVVPGVTITSTAEFDASYKAMLLTLAGGLLQRTGFPATIVVANIPNVDDIPYFWSVPVFNSTLPGALGGSWPPGFAEDNVELVRFPVATWLETANPASDPIPANYTLTSDEVDALEAAVLAYNTTITTAVAMVNGSGLANCGLVDANTLMAELPTAQKTHFLLIAGQALLGGADVDAAVELASNTTLFSLDGIHPNNAGYAIIADAFLDEIGRLTDQSFGAVAAPSWDPTYGHPGTSGKAQSTIAKVEGAMANLFR